MRDTTEALAELAGMLLDRMDDEGWPEAPALLAVADDPELRPDGRLLHALSLAGKGDPVEVLCHQQADPTWDVVGVRVQGWTVPAPLLDDVDWRTLTRDGPRLAEHPARQRVDMLHLVSRDGAVALAMAPDGAGTEVHTAADGSSDKGPVGPLVDGLRRMFGLATPPCPVPPVELWAIHWLEDACASHRRGVLRSWRLTAGRHPAVQLMASADPTLRHATIADIDPVEHLVAAGRALARVHDWNRLQLAVATGEWGAHLMTSAVASWADAGMFARLVLRGLPPLWALVRDVEQRASPSVRAEVLSTLDAWDLDWTPPTTTTRTSA